MLKEKLRNDLVSAMKEKNQIKTDTIRAVNTVILNKMHANNNIVIDDNVIIQIIQKEVKLRNDSIELFIKADRQDLINRAKLEIGYLQQYLPKMLDESEIKLVIEEVINTLDNQPTKKDIGKIMKNVMNQLQGKADGKLVNQIVMQYVH